MPTKTEFLKRCTVTEHSVVRGILIVRDVKMSDIEILVYGFLIIATGGSYYLGRQHGIRDTVDFLEMKGLIDFTDTPQK
jgi:hypothetical protein